MTAQTINIYVTNVGDVKDLVDGLSAAPAVVDAPAPAPDSAPMTSDQRRALFGVFEEVFASRKDAARYLVTRTVLGLDDDAPVSWSEYKAGRLTYVQAAYLIKTLRDLAEVL